MLKYLIIDSEDRVWGGSIDQSEKGWQKGLRVLTEAVIQKVARKDIK